MCLHTRNTQPPYITSHSPPFPTKCLTAVASFLVSWGGGRLSPRGTSATNWPTVPAPDDRWWWWWWMRSSRWNENWHGKPKYSEKTCPSTTLPTTNPTWPDLGSNSGRRGGKPATNRLNYDTTDCGRLLSMGAAMPHYWQGHIIQKLQSSIAVSTMLSRYGEKTRTHSRRTN
jgi:hypothetical protein